MLAAAENSLALGQGPARGTAVGCQNASRTTVNCSTFGAPGANPPSASPFLYVASPSARYGARWDVDPDYPSSPLILFGGASSSDPNQPTYGAPGLERGIVFGDTWALTGSPLAYSSNAWTNITPTGCPGESSCPLPRHDMGIAFDATDGYLIMFGGCEYPSSGWVENASGCPLGGILGDTWKFSAVGSNWVWTRILINGVKCGNPGEPNCPSSKSPSPRYGHAMTNLDVSNSGPVLLFGGCGTVGDTIGNCSLGDTWEFTGGIWSQIPVGGRYCGGPYTLESPCPLGGSPSNRWGASLANLGGSGKMVGFLFGGCGTAAVGCAPIQVYGDTWTFTPVGGWSQLGSCGGPPPQPSCGSTAPSPRYYAAFLGTGMGDVCLFGGTGGLESASLGADGDGWGFNAGNNGWAGGVLSPAFAALSVAPRFDGVLTASDQCQTEALYGGTSSSGSSLGDTQATHWVSGTGSYGYTLWPPAIPSARFAAAMTYDSVDSIVVLFGGCGVACPSNDTWTYGACRATPVVTCDTGLGSPLMWTLWNNSIAASANAACRHSYGCPAARYDASMAFDGSEAVLFGGLATSGQPLSDSWYFTSNAGWVVANCTGNCPSARFGASIAYDPTITPAGVVMFGGTGALGLLQDTWEWTNLLTWTKLSPSGSIPPARTNGSMAYDTADSYLVLYGGNGPGPALLGDTWKYTGGSWTQLSPSNSPGALSWASMAYDSADGYIVLFGGAVYNFPPYHTTWKFSAGTWTTISPLSCVPTCPDSVDSASLAFDGGSGANYLLLFGGDSAPRTVVNNVSAYSGQSWHSFSSANPVKDPVPAQARPLGALGARLAYDPVLNRVVLVSGCGAICIPFGFSTWEYFNGSWIATPFIVSDPGGTGPCPAPVCFPEFDPAVAYLPSLNALVVFGGYVLDPPGGGAGIMGDTWELLPNIGDPGGVWDRVNFTTAPAPRADAMLVDDVHDGYLLLFGGCADIPSPYGGCLKTRADTWTFNGAAWTQINTNGRGPTGRAGAGMVYSPSAGLVLLVEGWNGTSHSALGDEWSYTGGTWTSQGISAIVPARWDLAAAWDAYENSVVAFGGFGCSVTNVTAACGDTWLAAGTAFSLDRGLGTATVSPRGDSAIAFTPVSDPDGEILLFAGGQLGSPGESDTFQFLSPTGWFPVSPWV
jgi:galactose oxidase-like protein